jgi:hypothetical protein
VSEEEEVERQEVMNFDDDVFFSFSVCPYDEEWASLSHNIPF